MQKTVESVLPTLFKYFPLPSVNLFIQFNTMMKTFDFNFDFYQVFKLH